MLFIWTYPCPTCICQVEVLKRLHVVVYVSGLKLDEVIQFIKITFCPGQMDLTWFILYLDLTRILHWIMCVNNGTGPDQRNELGMLDGDDGSIPPDSP